jgi:hypothetical protein
LSRDNHGPTHCQKNERVSHGSALLSACMSLRAFGMNDVYGVRHVKFLGNSALAQPSGHDMQASSNSAHSALIVVSHPPDQQCGLIAPGKRCELNRTRAASPLTPGFLNCRHTDAPECYASSVCNLLDGI